VLDPRYTTHSCRRTYATILNRACGGDLKVVQEQLGHAGIKTTTIHAKVTKEDKAWDADSLAEAYRSLQQNRESGATRRHQAPS
jgi:integrase